MNQIEDGIRKALDEINRLRAENERLRDENICFREALEKIAKEQSGVTAFQVADWFQQIARAALQPK